MSQLENYRAPVEVKLSALWTSTMLCYIYCDYFGLFERGVVAEMNRGVMGPLGPAFPALLIDVSIMMAVPSVMIALSLMLPAKICRWTNLLLGSAYTAIMALSLPGSPPFYWLFALVEMALTIAIGYLAFRWPRV